MVKLLMFYLGFLLIKAVLVMLPGLIKTGIYNLVPRRQYTAEEIITCKHENPDLYYQKQFTEQKAISKNKIKIRYKLKPKNIITLESTTTNTYKEVDINVIREQFKNKMKNRQLTRSQIIAIRKYLEQFVDCKQKKFSNDCHCIYYCLKRLDSEQIVNMTALLNLLK